MYKQCSFNNDVDTDLEQLSRKLVKNTHGVNHSTNSTILLNLAPQFRVPWSTKPLLSASLRSTLMTHHSKQGITHAGPSFQVVRSMKLHNGEGLVFSYTRLWWWQVLVARVMSFVVWWSVVKRILVSNSKECMKDRKIPLHCIGDGVGKHLEL